MNVHPIRPCRPVDGGAAHRHVRVWAIAVAMVAVGLAMSPADGARAQATAASSDPTSEIIELTNVERARAKRSPLRANARLSRAARLHAEQMARAEQLGHVLPDARYPRPEDRLAAVDYDWMAWAENVASGQPSPARAVADWMRSRGHRRNMLNELFREIGAARAVDARGRAYYVQVFGTERRRRDE